MVAAVDDAGCVVKPRCQVRRHGQRAPAASHAPADDDQSPARASRQPLHHHSSRRRCSPGRLRPHRLHTVTGTGIIELVTRFLRSLGLAGYRISGGGR